MLVSPPVIQTEKALVKEEFFHQYSVKGFYSYLLANEGSKSAYSLLELVAD